MPGFLVHVGSITNCTHPPGAVVASVVGPPRVFVNLQPVLTVANLLTVAGCPFQIPFGVGTKPQPCVTVKWANVATRVFVSGQPPLLQASPGPGAGICQSVEQIPQGPPIVSVLQMRVTAM